MDSSDVTKAAHQVGDSAPVEWGARLGYAASGLLHLIMGWITLRIALGSSGKGDKADQSGALQSIAETTGGGILLWVVTAGFALLALWQLTEAITGGPGHSDAGDRAKAAGKTVMYAALAYSSMTFALGGRSSSSKDTKDFTSALLGMTGGRLLVGLLGVVVVGIGGYHVYKGWSKGFLRDLAEHPPAFAVHAGRFGYIAKGVALIIVGGLFVVGAWQRSTAKTTGLDGALKTLREGPFGTGLLAVVALGIMAYGVYSFARAKSARV